MVSMEVDELLDDLEKKYPGTKAALSEIVLEDYLDDAEIEKLNNSCPSEESDV